MIKLFTPTQVYPWKTDKSLDVLHLFSIVLYWGLEHTMQRTKTDTHRSLLVHPKQRVGRNRCLVFFLNDHGMHAARVVRSKTKVLDFVRPSKFWLNTSRTKHTSLCRDDKISDRRHTKCLWTWSEEPLTWASVNSHQSRSEAGKYKVYQTIDCTHWNTDCRHW